jgi:hypothetical protein
LVISTNLFSVLANKNAFYAFIPINSRVGTAIENSFG